MTASQPPPGLRELARTFGKIGLTNFGGPAGQIALMHRVLVEEKRWIEDERYLRALNFCTLLPGPEAQQLAIYVGWKLRGSTGGVLAGILFVLPGAAVVLALAVLYAYAADLKPVAAALSGVKAAVLAIVAEALLRLGRRALRDRLRIGVAAASFVALFVFRAPFPLVVLGAGLVGPVFAGETARVSPGGPAPAPRLGASLGRLAGWSALWAAPLVLARMALGPDHVLVRVGGFFAKLALVTFGGAYAVLSYMAQQAVETYGWLRPGEMVDGLGLAETTPGPLILVTEFVGFLAAFRAPAPFAPLAAGLLGAGLTLWMTFVPSFLWIFVGGPFIERLEHARRLQGALSAITAAVVGVISNLTVWFGLHVLFARFIPWRLGPARLDMPDPTSFQPLAALLSLSAALLLFRLRLGVIRTLLASLALGLLAHALHLA